MAIGVDPPDRHIPNNINHRQLDSSTARQPWRIARSLTLSHGPPRVLASSSPGVMLSRRQQPAVRSLTSSRRTSSRQLHWRSQWRLQPPLLKSSLYAAETSNVSPGKNLKAQRQEPDGGRKLTYPKKRAASLYEELFGSGSQKSKMSKPLGSLGQERIEDHREDRRQHLEEASIFQDSELSAYVDSNVASDQRRDPPTTPALGLSPAPQRTCLRLFSLSKSLLVSDFARLANQGNLDGWSSNLINVMQVRSPITQEPEGEYFLIFNSPTAARAYAESLEKLHETAYDAATERLKSLTRLPAKQALGSNDVNQGSGSGGVEAEATAEESSDRDQGQDQDRDATLPMRKLLDTRQNRDATEDKNRKRLVTLLSGPAHFTGDPNRVLVKLHGSKITALDLRAAIDADGRARNLAWKLSNQSWSPSETEEEEEEGEDFNGGGDAPHLQAEEAGAKARRSARKRKWEEEKIRMIHPLPYSESLKMYKDEDGEARDPIKKRFGAFVVSFADHVESKRFVRVWHKRELADKTRDMTMTVHASSLW
ncbi:hypothetical protein B0T17DRAFT_651928 [Bombardia bombarda]|uniref:Uncharacterized protein n=1 Tax=Bombardia bombarda TaxID=252184 RepID=A0AA39XNK8_9PEZI|nr:hypothetical protein B0T17DRAFT_651928 [Bombardia bombarda]